MRERGSPHHLPLPPFPLSSVRVRVAVVCMCICVCLHAHKHWRVIMHIVKRRAIKVLGD